MNGKIIAAIAAVVLVVAVVAAIAVSSMDDDSDHITEGVIYDGNGGMSSDGKTRFELTGHEVMTNLFEKKGFEFKSWNTKADGTRTAYMPKDHIDYASNRTVTLYAQWQEPAPHVTGFTTGGVVIPLTATLNGKSLDQFACFFIPLTATGNIIELQYGGDATWSVDQNIFTIVSGLEMYKVTVTVNNAADVVYSINSDGNPSVTFSADQDITISLSVKQPK